MAADGTVASGRILRDAKRVVPAAIGVAGTSERYTGTHAGAYLNKASLVQVIHDADVIGLVVGLLLSQKSVNGLVANRALAVCQLHASIAIWATSATAAGLVEMAVVVQTQVVSEFMHEGDGHLEAGGEPVVVNHTPHRHHKVVARELSQARLTKGHQPVRAVAVVAAGNRAVDLTVAT